MYEVHTSIEASPQGCRCKRGRLNGDLSGVSQSTGDQSIRSSCCDGNCWFGGGGEEDAESTEGVSAGVGVSVCTYCVLVWCVVPSVEA